MTMAGGLGTQVMGIIRQAGDVFNQILRDPVGFAGNLVAAVRGGLGAFLSNVGTHLRNGLIGWLTGSLGGAHPAARAFRPARHPRHGDGVPRPDVAEHPRPASPQ